MTRRSPILIVGGGAREHAICWKLKEDDPSVELHAAPGNPGIAQLAVCYPVAADDSGPIINLAGNLDVSLVVIGPEAPLAAGLADRLSESGRWVFGPSAAAARIESSKSFAKELMLRHQIPTARASSHTSPESAKRAARALEGPVVVKASGLAAGKGVVICPNLDDADAAIDAMLTTGALGESGTEILIEEFMEGEEISVFAVCDGKNFVLLAPSQDHKRLLEGDVGPNTGGMGAYAPVSLATDAILARTSDEIIRPTLEAMSECGAPFTGLLYAGLMLTASGPKVVEFNCRFGDPETQVVLPLMLDGLADLLTNASRPGGLAGASQPRFSNRSALTTVMAARGYPSKPETGTRISMPSSTPPDALIFHAGTKEDAEGKLMTAGGRVFSVTGIGDTLEAARERSHAAAATIAFEGSQWRRDIGRRELPRLR